VPIRQNAWILQEVYGEKRTRDGSGHACNSCEDYSNVSGLRILNGGLNGSLNGSNILFCLQVVNVEGVGQTLINGEIQNAVLIELKAGDSGVLSLVLRAVVKISFLNSVSEGNLGPLIPLYKVGLQGAVTLIMSSLGGNSVLTGLMTEIIVLTVATGETEVEQSTGRLIQLFLSEGDSVSVKAFCAR